MKLIEVAARAFVFRDRKETDHYLESMYACFNGLDEPDPMEYKSREILSWALNRWGRQWSELEYELRDKLSVEYYSTH